VTATELQEVLRLHVLWLQNDPEGVMADLRVANLRGADLRGANLREANLIGADLSGANLRDADLRRADLIGAYLSGANLRRANLGVANLGVANLSDANLRDADLIAANLRNANLRNADLSGANLRDADLRRADLSGAQGLPIVADAPARLQAVAAQILSNPACLRMSEWHSDCGTTHCLAGWAIHQAGSIGATLEALHGPHLAGLLLLGHDAAAQFYQSNDSVLEWLRTISGELER
jgi:hypothetical protein